MFFYKSQKIKQKHHFEGCIPLNCITNLKDILLPSSTSHGNKKRKIERKHFFSYFLIKQNFFKKEKVIIYLFFM